MDRDAVDRWLQAYVDGWKTYDPDQIAAHLRRASLVDHGRSFMMSYSATTEPWSSSKVPCTSLQSH